MRSREISKTRDGWLKSSNRFEIWQPFRLLYAKLLGNMNTLIDTHARSYETLGDSWIWHFFRSLQWRHNGRDGVSNHEPPDCLLTRLFRHKDKKNIEAPRHWPLCGKFTGIGEFPAQMARNAEKVFIWWRHHVSKRRCHRALVSLQCTSVLCIYRLRYGIVTCDIKPIHGIMLMFSSIKSAEDHLLLGSNALKDIRNYSK